MRGGAARYQCSSSPPNRSLYRRRPRLGPARLRSEEHTSELQSQSNLVCRLLLEKKKKHILSISVQFQSKIIGLVRRQMMPLLVCLTADLRCKEIIRNSNRSIRKSVPYCKIRLNE